MRELRILNVNVHRPERRMIGPDGNRLPATVQVAVEHSDLKSRPLTMVDLTADQAIELAAELLEKAMLLRRHP